LDYYFNLAFHSVCQDSREIYENVLESVRLVVEDVDWSSQTTRHSSEILENKNILRHVNHIYFLVCNSCLWCATYFGIDDLKSLSTSPTRALSCQLCNSCNTELMPISADVSSRMKYDITTGIEMEFYRTNNVVDRQQSIKEVRQVSVFL
jgi:hypothetical protein